MKKSIYNIDTGRMIESFRLKEKISVSELGRKLFITPNGATNYTRNKSINTNTLISICYAFRHNFLLDMANELPKDFSSNVAVDPAKQALDKEQQDLIAQLQEENKVLKIQNELLLRIQKV